MTKESKELIAAKDVMLEAMEKAYLFYGYLLDFEYDELRQVWFMRTWYLAEFKMECIITSHDIYPSSFGDLMSAVEDVRSHRHDIELSDRKRVFKEIYWERAHNEDYGRKKIVDFVRHNKYPSIFHDNIINNWKCFEDYLEEMNK